MARRLWFLSPGGCPVRAEAPPEGAQWWSCEGDTDWKPVSSGGWKEHSAFYGNRSDDAASKRTKADGAPSTAAEPADPENLQKSPARLITQRRATHRRKRGPAPGQGTLFYARGAQTSAAR